MSEWKVALNPLECALDEAQAFRRQADALRAENAKLREENERFIIKLNAEHIARQNVETENDRLRELLADAWDYINHPANATWTHKKRKEARDSLSDRMRELGVEVASV